MWNVYRIKLFLYLYKLSLAMHDKTDAIAAFCFKDLIHEACFIEGRCLQTFTVVDLSSKAIGTASAKSVDFSDVHVHRGSTLIA